MKVKKFLKEAGVYKMVKKELRGEDGNSERIATLMEHETRFVSPLELASPIAEMFSFHDSIKGANFWRTIDKGLQARMAEMGLEKPVN